MTVAVDACQIILHLLIAIRVNVCVYQCVCHSFFFVARRKVTSFLKFYAVIPFELTGCCSVHWRSTWCECVVDRNSQRYTSPPKLTVVVTYARSVSLRFWNWWVWGFWFCFPVRPIHFDVRVVVSCHAREGCCLALSWDFWFFAHVCSDFVCLCGNAYDFCVCLFFVSRFISVFPLRCAYFPVIVASKDLAVGMCENWCSLHVRIKFK